MGFTWASRVNLTDVGIATVGILKFLPVDAIGLTILVENTQNVGICNIFNVALCFLPSSVIFEGLDSCLDAFIVEVGVVILLELLEKLLELFDPVLESIALVDDVPERLAELLDSCLGQTDENAEFAASALTANDLALFLLLYLAVLPREILILSIKSYNLLLERGNRSLDSLSELLGLVLHGAALLGSLFHVLPLLLFESSVFFANLCASVLALDAPNAAVLLRAIAAEVVIADAVVNVGEGDVHANVTLIGAPEARQGIGCICSTGYCARERLFRREGVDVGAGSGARFVGAIGAVARVVVDLAQAQLDCSIGDTKELILVLVVGSDCRWGCWLTR